MVKAKRPKKVGRRYDGKYVVHDGSDACSAFVYFVIQKVACTSIKTALLPLFPLDTSPFEVTRQNGSRGVQVHRLFDRSRYQVDKNEFLPRLDEEYHDYFKFAFVRNPWDRLVSCYFEKIDNRFRYQDLNPPGEKDRFYPRMPFAEFVEAVHATPDETANHHFRSQHTTVCDSGGRVMADFVGRFENLREDFALVAERIGAPGLELPHRVKSRTRGERHYRDLYDEKLQGLVYERYEKDVETFGYSF
jgi:chondroitin 4-sulfotransferase 11